MNPIDIGFDPSTIPGHYPVSQTARPLTDAEQAVIYKALAHGKSAADHAREAMAVANGKPVSKIWIVSDPVAELVGRAQRALGNWWEK